MAKNLKETRMNQEAHQNGHGGEDIAKMLRGEFETWELIRSLNLADRVYFKHLL
jgi:hypothetical protein